MRSDGEYCSVGASYALQHAWANQETQASHSMSMKQLMRLTIGNSKCADGLSCPTESLELSPRQDRLMDLSNRRGIHQTDRDLLMQQLDQIPAVVCLIVDRESKPLG